MNTIFKEWFEVRVRCAGGWLSFLLASLSPLAASPEHRSDGRYTEETHGDEEFDFTSAAPTTAVTVVVPANATPAGTKNPFAWQQPRSNQPVPQHIQANYTPGVDEESGYSTTTYGKAPEVPSGEFRSPLFDCCTKFPHCCVAWCCPWVIWAQAHKFLHGGIHPTRGVRGFYVIIVGFSLLTFVTAAVGTYERFVLAQALADLGFFLGVMVLCSLFRHIRIVYNIHGNMLGNFCCGSCNDGCDDVLKSACCLPCATYQLGNHLFNYDENMYVTYDPVPTVLNVEHRERTIV